MVRRLSGHDEVVLYENITFIYYRGVLPGSLFLHLGHSIAHFFIGAPQYGHVLKSESSFDEVTILYKK